MMYGCSLRLKFAFFFFFLSRAFKWFVFVRLRSDKEVIGVSLVINSIVLWRWNDDVEVDLFHQLLIQLWNWLCFQFVYLLLQFYSEQKKKKKKKQQLFVVAVVYASFVKPPTHKMKS